VIGGIAAQIGFMPNVARLLAVTPDHFVGWWRYFDDLMRGPSGLSKTQREMIAVIVSAEAHCPYCEIAHAAALRLRTKDAELVDRRGELPPRGPRPAGPSDARLRHQADTDTCPV
jgi:uncharacterized peroxidase-related enzyme